MFGLLVSGEAGERARRVLLVRTADGRHWLSWPGGQAELPPTGGPRAPGRSEARLASDPTRVVAPVAGRVTAVAVAVGDAVVSGQRLASLEAMKMEFSLVAEVDGRVAAIGAGVGDVLGKGALVITLAAKES